MISLSSLDLSAADFVTAVLCTQRCLFVLQTQQATCLQLTLLLRCCVLSGAYLYYRLNKQLVSSWLCYCGAVHSAVPICTTDSTSKAELNCTLFTDYSHHSPTNSLTANDSRHCMQQWRTEMTGPDQHTVPPVLCPTDLITIAEHNTRMWQSVPSAKSQLHSHFLHQAHRTPSLRSFPYL